MTDTYNMHDAKTQLSRLAERAANGDEIVIARNGRPLARLVPIGESRPLPIGESRPRKLGLRKDSVRTSDDFDDPLPRVPAHGSPAPIGFAAIAGCLADWDELDEVVRDIYLARRAAEDRPVKIAD
jgi:prevent-host-death family protein